jgi:hypothetical protein
MKRTRMVLLLVLMVGIVAFVPSALMHHKPNHPHGPTPTATPAPQLTAPILVSPPNGTTLGVGDVTFTWEPVPGAAYYHIQAGGIIDYWSLTEPSYTFNVTAGFIIYFPRLYWHVQAIDANGNQGPWSDYWVINFVNS